MEEGDNGRDAVLNELVDDIVVVLETGFVHGSFTEREDAWPADAWAEGWNSKCL